MEEVSVKKSVLSAYLFICVVSIILAAITGNRNFLLVAAPISICFFLLLIAITLVILVGVLAVVGLPVMGIIYLVTRVLGIAFQPAFNGFKSVLSFLLGMAAFKYVNRFRKKGGMDIVRKQKDEAAFSGEPKITIPRVFDVDRIDADLRKYRSDETALQIYIASLAERFRSRTERKVLEEKLKYMKIGKEYLDAAYEAKVAEHRLRRVDEEQELIRRKLDEKHEILDLKSKVKRKRLEVRLSELESNEKKLRGDKKPSSDADELEKKMEEARREIALTLILQTAQIEGYFERAKLRAVQEEKIREEYPEEADRIIDIVDQMMAEEPDEK